MRECPFYSSLTPMNELLTKVLKEAIDRNPKVNPCIFSYPRTGKPFAGIKTFFTKTITRIGREGLSLHDVLHAMIIKMYYCG